MIYHLKRAMLKLGIAWLDLSKPDRIGVIAMAVIVMVALIVAVAVPRARAEEEETWRSPSVQLPEQGEEVVGFCVEYFAEKAEDGTKITYGVRGVREPLVFLRFSGDDAEGKFSIREYWLYDDGKSTTAPDMMRPLFWAPRRLAKTLKDPDIPNLLLKARARK